MTSIENVLVAVGPTDRDHVETLIDEAIAVAGPTGATVYLLHVFSREEYEELQTEMGIDPTTSELGPDQLAARHSSIQTPVSHLEDHGIQYEIRGIVGTPHREIVTLADELGVDRVFIGGAARSPTGKAVFGDHAQRVLLKSSAPVTYVQRD